MADIPGGPDPDSLPGTGEDDRITGLAGNDTLDGLEGNDLLYGGADDDSLLGGGGMDSLFGGTGNDWLEATGTGLLLRGGDGDDRLVFGPTIGAGTGGRGFGGDGDDLVSVSGPVGVTVEGGAGLDVLALTPYLTGLGNAPALIDFSTGSGTATAAGGQSMTFAGFEYLYFNGGAGADTVTGGDLADTIFGGRGDNDIAAGAGDDVVAIGYGLQQTLDGGAGDDLLIVIDAYFPVYFIIGNDGSVDDGQLSQITGFETYEIEGSAFDDVVRAGDGGDLLGGYGGDDWLAGDDGDDFVFGQGGEDTVDGGEGRDHLSGGNHGDVASGGGGDDRIFGGAGEDGLEGGDGNDTIVGGAGFDVLTGGADRDVFRFTQGLDGDLVTDFAAGEDRLMIRNSLLGGNASIGRQGSDDLAFGAPNRATGQFVYVTEGGMGSLYWDADGTGSGDAALVAAFQGEPALTAADIFVF
jgi:Ca2+-binding RTX toxin-like protein